MTNFCFYLVFALFYLCCRSFSFSQYPFNPIVIPTQPHGPNGCVDNVYSQELLYYHGILVMYYGGWEADYNDCHDRIYLAYSLDGVNWRKYGTDELPTAVLTNGDSRHVNDPSIVLHGGVTMMYYTDNALENGSYVDRIWLATSSYLNNFQKWGQVLHGGPPGTWNEFQVGRPAVIFDQEENIFKMWFDGSNRQGTRCVGYANSTDGYHFTPYVKNPIFCPGGGIDVKKIGGQYFILQEGGQGTTWGTSSDGIMWDLKGLLIPLSGKSFDKYGQVVPSFQFGSNGSLEAVWFGGASVSEWDRNRIAAAYADGIDFPKSGGCTGCAQGGLSCARDCQKGTSLNDGNCGKPGSTEPSACCVCFNDGCQKCLAGFVDCHAACVSAGHVGGYCAVPGSTDPSRCCGCL